VGDGALATANFLWYVADAMSALTADSILTRDPGILGGIPVFKGTRVPIHTLFDYLSDGLSLEYFLESFPSVNRELATNVLRLGQERIEHEVVA
jgi:uncharacterized protein (DUF433 family)